MGLSAAVLAGCAVQPPYLRPELAAPSRWSADAAASATAPARPLWWRALNDPPLSAFVEATLDDNPTLAQAVARLDEARAQVGLSAARRLPSVTASAGASRAKAFGATVGSSSTGTDAVAYANTASIGPAIDWAPDLFGRVRQSVEAANRRLDARSADAEAVRLALAADVVADVLALRACEHGRDILAEDIRSRELSLTLVRQRVAVGYSAPVEVTRSRSGLASARTSLAARDEQCSRTVNALVALGASNATTVRALVPLAAPSTDTGSAASMASRVPEAALELPALVLAQHPSVRSAEREAAAAWADIGIARADRWPRVDLMAALSGQWLSAAGSTLRTTAWSLGATVSGTLFDGGAGAASVDAAEARYRAAVAALRQSVLTAAREVENALAASSSAEARAASTAASVDAARQAFLATQDQWRAGAVSLFELEDSRRQFVAALDAAVAADRDRGQAWVALVRASGNALFTSDQGHP